MDKMVSVYRETGQLFSRVRLANSFGARLRGLMFYPEMPDIDGLLLVSCSFVHMFWRRVPLDLIYLSRDREVLLTVEDLAPYKIGPFVKKSFFILETAAGIVALKNIRRGDQIWWQ